MSALALRAESLSKRFSIGDSSHAQENLREAMMRRLVIPRRARKRTRSDNDVWALRDVTFEVKQGEAVGIIGRNGAGKSTLLKILSRIMEPTSGRAAVRGRVGSLLEIGTGFHPELTGRENVFLNGAVLGMSRADIKLRFDDIAEFSGIEKFLDTPVKYYSSGMYTRLAFAVAAHLEPEVLIVDEVLAVGDGEFQKKCLGKMSSVASEGRTVLFVSHNLAAVEALCQRAILLELGHIACNALPAEVISAYRPRHGGIAASVDLSQAAGREDGMQPILRRMELRDASGSLTGAVRCGEALTVELWYEHKNDLRMPAFAIRVEAAQGTRLFHLASDIVGGMPTRAGKRGKAVCVADSLPLVPGRYSISLGCRSGPDQLDLIEGAACFDVLPGDYYGTGHLPRPENGPVLARGSWSVVDVG